MSHLSHLTDAELARIAFSEPENMTVLQEIAARFQSLVTRIQAMQRQLAEEL